jgi:hypothetical protein
MSEFKGTNGVWFLSGTEIVSMPSQTKICKVNGKTYEEAKANARLISFAPEILEMLIFCEKALNDIYKCDTKEIKELIKKSTQP